MKKCTWIFMICFLATTEGCAMYMTHREIGFQRLIGCDIASHPTGSNEVTVPLVPQHTTIPKPQQLPAPQAVPMAQPKQVYFVECPCPSSQCLPVSSVPCQPAPCDQKPLPKTADLTIQPK